MILEEIVVVVVVVLLMFWCLLCKGAGKRTEGAHQTSRSKWSENRHLFTQGGGGIACGVCAERGLTVAGCVCKSWHPDFPCRVVQER